MAQIALAHRPPAVCLVPEKRHELTTEGGLDVAGAKAHLTPFVERLSEAGIRVALFVDPDAAQVEAAREVGAPAVELHTGAYCDGAGPAREEELQRLVEAASYGDELGLEIHAGHGLTFDTVGPVAAIPEVVELNIGHFLVGEAIFFGLKAAITRMREGMDRARAGAAAPLAGTA